MDIDGIKAALSARGDRRLAALRLSRQQPRGAQPSSASIEDRSPPALVLPGPGAGRAGGVLPRHRAGGAQGLSGRPGPLPLVARARGRLAPAPQGHGEGGDGVPPDGGHPLRGARRRGHRRDGPQPRPRGRQLGRPRAEIRVALDAGAAALHARAAEGCTRAKDEAFALIRERLAAGRELARKRSAGVHRPPLRRAGPVRRPSRDRGRQRPRLRSAFRDRRPGRATASSRRATSCSSTSGPRSPATRAPSTTTPPGWAIADRRSRRGSRRCGRR